MTILTKLVAGVAASALSMVTLAPAAMATKPESGKFGSAIERAQQREARS